MAIAKITTNPNVFIIESLDWDDEENNRFEGRLLADMLELSGKQPIYKYIRTSQEFEYFFDEFCNSEYRYLHISCHGSSESIATTFGEMSFADLAEIMEGRLKGKRIFLSACEAVNQSFADTIIYASECNSVVGPTTKLYTSDALIFWSSFYHIIFKENPIKMDMRMIKNALNNLMKLHGGFKFKYFYKSNGRVKEAHIVNK
ncbi:hypothetical protein SAMN05192574_102256 [Mucilaginibacter gossypiicola]|uniref:CHAT domain-containing protein n=1 Tax=Mucilaginibacter gossypiicola TaxID=551995 RepID=A0A1H8D904_9SPHI|nr:hypothetical protein [Mucilaginibacter gossypiicola]SEN03723.1 hypothetical protein SAMN05192574_102256 [Mucilaginibacter gossypiicola]